MSLTAIIILIILGIILFYVEFLIIPGVTIAGIAGFILVSIAIYYGYKEYGTPGGHYILGATALLIIFSMAVMLRTKTWERVGLHSKIEGKSTASLEGEVNVGDQGITVTRLNPYGKVQINDKYYEAKSAAAYIDQKTNIEIKKIDGTHLIVKSIN